MPQWVFDKPRQQVQTRSRAQTPVQTPAYIPTETAVQTPNPGKLLHSHGSKHLLIVTETISCNI